MKTQSLTNARPAFEPSKPKNPLAHPPPALPNNLISTRFHPTLSTAKHAHSLINEQLNQKFNPLGKDDASDMAVSPGNSTASSYTEVTVPEEIGKATTVTNKTEITLPDGDFPEDTTGKATTVTNQTEITLPEQFPQETAPPNANQDPESLDSQERKADMDQIVLDELRETHRQQDIPVPDDLNINMIDPATYQQLLDQALEKVPRGLPSSASQDSGITSTATSFKSARGHFTPDNSMDSSIDEVPDDNPPHDRDENTTASHETETSGTATAASHDTTSTGVRRNPRRGKRPATRRPTGVAATKKAMDKKKPKPTPK